MKYAYVLVLWCLLFTGCASQNIWVSPSRNASEAQKDFGECKYDSQKSSFVPYGNGTSPISAGVQEGFQSVTLMNECMRSRGYSLVDKYEWEAKQANNSNNRKEYDSAMKLKDYPRALEMAAILISDNPSSATAYALRGHAYYNLSKYDDAITAYNKAIALDDKHIGAISMKAICFAENGEHDIALELANIAVNIKNSDSSVFNNRAVVYNKKGDYDKALEDCNKSLALNNSSPSAHRQKGLAYFGKEHYEKSIVEFNKAITIDSMYDKAYLGRGEAYLKLGKADNATSDFKKACELGNKESCSKVK